jgi:type I restriction enzyme, S subunit
LISFQGIDNEFLYYLVSTSKQKFIERSFGSTFLEISKKNISEIVFAIPPFAEQQAIATALSDVDELIRSLDGLIQKKEAIKKGTMQQLLSGKKRLPGFDGEWEVKALGEVCQIISGGTPSTRNSKYWDGEIKWCTPTDITKTKYKYLESTARKISSEGLKNSSATLLPEGTLLLCSRATVGEVKIATNEISTNQGFKSLICSDSVDNEYLFYLINLNKQKFIDKAFGSTFLEISKKNTADIEFEFPSVEEQKAIAEILSDMDEELQALRRKREKMVRVKEGMMQQLLTGRIRILGIEG